MSHLHRFSNKCYNSVYNLTLTLPDALRLSKLINSLSYSGAYSSGKTTLLQKICHDWATCNATWLRDVDTIIYLDLSLVNVEMPYTDICDCILKQGK